MTLNETGHLPLCPNCHSSMNRMLMDRPGHEGTWYYDMDLFACPDCEPHHLALKQFGGPGVMYFEENEDGFRIHTYRNAPLITDTKPDPSVSLVLCKCGKSPCKHNPEVASYWAVGEHRPMTKAMLFYLHFKDSPEPENIPDIDDWEPGE